MLPLHDPATLSSPASLFVGRAADLALLAAHLADPHCRLITIIGPAGIGKTRLARAAVEAAAASFAHGVAWVSLEGVRDNRDMLGAILADLGRTAEPERSASATLSEALAERELLLALDTCDLPAASAYLIADLLRDAPGLVILATARAPLGVRAERQLRLAGLPAPDAGQLFVSAARRAAPSFEPGPDDEEAIDAICASAEGSPLLIERAAAAVGCLSLGAIAHMLGANPEALRARASRLPARPRSPQAAFAWSWALLSERERALLADLALRGGLSSEVAASLDSARASDLEGLVRKSLVRREADGRYVVHGTALPFATPRERAVG